jgi:hypothetical protein
MKLFCRSVAGFLLLSIIITARAEEGGGKTAFHSARLVVTACICESNPPNATAAQAAK